MEENSVKTPWEAHMGAVPMHLHYFEGTMYEAVKEAACKYPTHIALDFMGKSTAYAELMLRIDECANALYHLGIRKNDTVTIALPNCPQAVYLFYAVNRIGAIANMVVSEVMMMGRRRRRPAVCTASIMGIPARRSSPMASSLRIESLMMTPHVVMIPMADMRLRV